MNFKVNGLTQPGLENCEVQIRTRDHQIPQSPKAGGEHSIHPATPTSSCLP